MLHLTALQHYFSQRLKSLSPIRALLRKSSGKNLSMAEHSESFYQYEALPTETSFRVFELLSGVEGDPISGVLHSKHWADLPAYEAISYAWGDPNARAPVVVDGKRLEVTVNLQTALKHLRFENRSRVLWVDAICINQKDIPERGLQVNQMRKIYEKAKTVLIWLGPDSEDHQAKVAIDSLITISDFLCDKLGMPVSKLGSVDNLYQQIMAKAHGFLPVPNECDFSTEAVWKSLVWLYSHPYFTRVWAIQEVNANHQRLLHCGHEKVLWDRASLVACYITMEPAFSQAFGFSNAYCWWAATVTTDMVQPNNWLSMLYLASNFSSMDPRDVIYGLKGMMNINKGEELLKPDYTKSVTDVYRDSVEAALVNFNKTDALLYVKGDEDPSWVPRWDIPMLFRNPFRFGKPLPWRPAGETSPVWSIDKKSSILSLSGFVVGPIKFVEPYNESVFGNAMTESGEGRRTLKEVWQRVLRTMRDSELQVPFSAEVLTAAATSFSFGLNEKSDPANESILLQRFVAYLKTALDEETYNTYIPADVSEDSKDAEGRLFGKPVWDFKYPESSFFITEDNSIGCSISSIRAGDVVYGARGSTYPLVMRPDGEEFRIRGFAYVHGLMHAEKKDLKVQILKIR